ncbi:MAG TPA: hypothetical protein VKY36_07365 [Moheibacter sp.]|nr:hypothetical protein [Moheibacter sp.]
MKIKLLGILLIALVIFSCETKKESAEEPTIIPIENASETASFHCYLFSNGKDSIRLSYQLEGNDLKGWMNYDFFEKDGSIGEVEGEIHGDTLKLQYKFLSEGVISKQQVYFLKKENYKLYRGSGEMEMSNDSVLVYSNPKEINFSDSTPLGELKTCPEDLIKQSDKEFYMKIKQKLE